MADKLFRKVFVLVLISTALTVGLVDTVNAALVGCWEMDEATSAPGTYAPLTPDGSSNGNDGILNGVSTTGTTLGYDGVGYCATIGEDGAILCGDDASLTPGAAGLSFASWVKFDALDKTYQLIGSNWSDSSQLFHFSAEQDNLRIHFGNADGHYYKSVGIADALTLDTWTHVAFTVAPAVDESTPGDIKLYMNGAEVASGTYEFTTLPVTINQTILGDKADYRGLYRLYGALDETALWTSVISGSDVSAMYGGTSPGSISTSTLGGHWSFENAATMPLDPAPTATVTDSSGFAHHGVMTPDGVEPFHPAGGKFGGAVELLRAEDHINVGDIDGISEEMTVACWIKPNDLNGVQVIASQSNDSNTTEWAWQIFLSGGSALFYVSDPTDHDGFVFVAEALGITTTDWTHLALTISSNDGAETGEVKAYANSVEVGSIAYDTESLVNSSEDIIFGNKANITPLAGFNGLIDDVGLFDTALSASEIADIFTNGINPDEVLIPGDTNNDKVVDETDAAMVASHWGDEIEGGASVGDFNEDGVVDATDASIMAANWGNHNQGTENGSVPEPSFVMIILGALAALGWPRRRG